MEQLPHFFLVYCILRVSDVRVVIKVVHINLNVVRLFLRLMPALARRIHVFCSQSVFSGWILSTEDV